MPAMVASFRAGAGYVYGAGVEDARAGGRGVKAGWLVKSAGRLPERETVRRAEGDR